MTNLARRSLAAAAAVDARDGATLFRYSTSAEIGLGKGPKRLGDGTFVVENVDVLKVGTYKGLTLDTYALDSLAGRHAELRDSGVFLPPFRLDHSLSVLSVIGWVEELRVAMAPDVSNGGADALYLRADVRFTGSLDYTPEQILEAIRSGALRNRSSELGPYVTNTGEELPLVFYGCAFVDIPAVEGLAPVALERRTSHAGPAAVIELSEGEAVQPEDETPVEVEETPVEVDEVDDDDANVPPVVPATPPLEPGEATDLEAEQARQDLDAHDGDEVDEVVPGPGQVGYVDPEDGSEIVEVVDDPAPADEDEEPADEPDATPEPAPAPEAPVSADLRGGADELERLRAENARLRAEQTEATLVELSSRGVVVPANREAATALLSHADESVGRHVRTLLANVPTLTGLNTVHGRQQLSAALSAAREGSQTPGGTAERIELGMSPDEVGVLWASLSTEERAKPERQAELAVWEKARRATT